MNSNVFQKSPSIIRATEKQRKREREVVAAPEAPIVPPWQWLILWAWTLFWMPAWISLWPDMIINTLFSIQLLHRGHITIWWTPHSRDLSSIIDMMQRKTEPFWAQPTLEILLALPLVMGPPCLSWKSFGLFALLGVYVLLSLPMDAWTPLLVRPHLEKIYPLLVDRFLPVHPGNH